jgi:hypothetical protein
VGAAGATVGKSGTTAGDAAFARQSAPRSPKIVSGETTPDTVLVVKQGAASGAVKLLANATLLGRKRGRSATFEWQVSVDGGATWRSLPATPFARTSVDGLPVLAVAAFRVCLVTETAGPWSQAASFRVH